jgi:hypothetical protein
MTKGEDGVYTGVLALPKGTRFDLKIVKSTVDGTSGGNNVWSAVHYKSVLNSDGAYDFGEFVDNLIPNGSFEEGAVKWTPSNCIAERDIAYSGDHCLAVGGEYSHSVSSDTFVIPPNQNLTYSTYLRTWVNTSVRIKVVDVSTQAVLFDMSKKIHYTEEWGTLSGIFNTGDLPVTAQVVCMGEMTSVFDTMSLVSV